jgi:Cof subfamily protein (haloacid dehalogenase superfamily)
MRQMIRLALSDMDNTLLPFGQDRVDERTLGAISTLRSSGVRFGPATGRDEQELHRFFAGDDSCFETGIVSNGKKVKVDGELVWARYLDRDALQRLADAFAPVPGVFVAVYPAKTDLSNPAYVLGATPAQMAPYERRFKFNGTIVSQVPDIDVIAATVACEEDEAMDWVRREAARVAPELVVVPPVPNWFDVLPRGVNKGTSLRHLLEALGIGPEEVVFFGDAENDLQIMGEIPNSVAVANATREAAEAARWHIGPCWDDAVADALLDIAEVSGTDAPPRFMRDGDEA